MDGFLMTATYATRGGNMGTQSLTLDRPTSEEAIAEFSRRLSKRGCSKISITNYGRPRT